MTAGYEWQDKVFESWMNANFKGVVNAVTASGKTRAGRKCIEQYLEFYPYDRIWVIANTKEVLNQWKAECSGIELEYFTYLGAVSRFEKLRREGKQRMYPDCIICDECHLLNAKESGRVLNYGVEHILAMSGTLNGSDKKVGPIIATVKYDEANIADTSVHLVEFTPTPSEMSKYDKVTASIDKYRDEHPTSTYYNDPVLQRRYLFRRQTAYKFASRVDHAMKIVERNIGRTIMIFCALQDQARAVAEELDKRGYRNTLHLSGQEGLSRFLSGEVDICVSCRKLQVGFNYPKADVAIIVSTPISPLTLCQTVGRIIRPYEGKHADIFILVARNTSDENIDRNKIFIKEKIDCIGIESFS